MANSAHQKGDIWSKDNYTEPISWIAHIQKLEEFKSMVEDRPTVCAYISKMIRKKNQEMILKLLETHSTAEVELMLELMDEFVKITVIEDYVILNL
ncbi:hypothetical protein [Pedobacter sp. L105]|uniref:hypothetical protein n=1 Tax=Pedobacter sp. L105 TaxID=1641871 RepID=UPI00131D730E|nr:hypothetical protein [Pedobacter sp. L105]